MLPPLRWELNPSYCFPGPRWLPSLVAERARSWLLEGGELGGRTRSILLPPLTLPVYRKGEVFDRLLNVNHGGVSFLLSSSVSLHFSWSWPQSE